MKFPNTKSETFFRNLIKHNLNRYEWKVLVAFIVDHPDPKEYSITLPEFVKRTGIKKPNASRSLRGLVFQGILIKDGNDWLLNKTILDSHYEPKAISSTNMRAVEESKNIKGNGNFKGQNEKKKKRNDEIIKNLRRMTKETAAKKRNKYPGWQTYFSNFTQSEVSAKVDQHGEGFVITWCSSGDPNVGRTSIAPQEVAEEFCREILKIEDPNEILKYMYSPYQYDFIRKYNLNKLK